MAADLFHGLTVSTFIVEVFKTFEKFDFLHLVSKL